MSAGWVPEMLTEEQKSKRIAPSLENLCRYQNEGESFGESIVKGGEIWAY
jgi:hypothetical protein